VILPRGASFGLRRINQHAVKSHSVVQTVLVALVCSLVFTNVSAQTQPAPAPRWEKIDGSSVRDAQGNQFFVDRGSLKHVDNTIEAAILVELPAAQLRRGAQVRSIIRIARFDCLRRRTALTALDSFSGTRGTGHAVEFIDMARNPPQWTEVESGSVDEAILGFICANA
jgi:hypothetical protein